MYKRWGNCSIAEVCEILGLAVCHDSRLFEFIVFLDAIAVSEMDTLGNEQGAQLKALRMSSSPASKELHDF